MKKLIITSAVMLIFSLTCLSQVSHLTRIYYFEGNDFDYSVKGMVGIKDSIYIISNTPDRKGQFFKIDQNGEGYRLIWKFDNLCFEPNSLVANDTFIYGTTRISVRGGGTIFRYSLKNYSYEFIKDFFPDEVQEIRVIYISDSDLWLTSQWSWVDNGSIFNVKRDGTGFKKIYNDTDSKKGENPVDFVFYNDSIYIACCNGGGTYPDGGSIFSTGCIIRIKRDGTGYQKLINGGNDKGTQPQSLIIRENKLIGLFAHSGSNHRLGVQFFRSNLDGTSYDSLGALSGRCLTRMLSTDSLIYGISISQIFGVNPLNGEIRIFDDLKNHTDLGYDMTASLILMNGIVFMAAQQGGPGGGGTILKWTIKAPDTEPQENPDTFLVYPNPTISVLNFSSEDFELVEIFSSTGRQIRSYKNPGRNINIVSLSNGVYLMRFKIDGSFHSKIIVKQ